jgi:hypothetical protein
MISRQMAALFTLLCLWSPTLADDLIGQASVIEGDTLEIHGTRIAFGASTRLRARSCAAANGVG